MENKMDTTILGCEVLEWKIKWKRTMKIEGKLDLCRLGCQVEGLDMGPRIWSRGFGFKGLRYVKYIE